MHEIRIYSDCKLLIAHFATPPKLPLFPFSKWQSCLSLSALPRLHVYDVPYIVIRIASFRQRTNERKKKKNNHNEQLTKKANKLCKRIVTFHTLCTRTIIKCPTGWAYRIRRSRQCRRRHTIRKKLKIMVFYILRSIDA